jgi:hypothetical protein
VPTLFQAAMAVNAQKKGGFPGFMNPPRDLRPLAGNCLNKRVAANPLCPTGGIGLPRSAMQIFVL